MNILLTGAAGQVGFELHRTLSPLGELTVTTRDGRLPGGMACEALDLSRPADLSATLDRLRPDVLVNPAAYTAVDRAESEPELARRVNTEAVEAMAHWCAGYGALFVHYSTDYVFSGEGGRAWTEADPTAPLGVYGSSKRDGELALIASGARHLIFRTAWVYAARGGNFLRTMLRLAGERDSLAVVDDQVGAPTPARWIASASAAVLARLHDVGRDVPASALFHLAAGGQTSWHGFAAAIMARATAAGLLQKAPALRAISSADYPTAARRPACSTLDTSHLARCHGLRLPDWSQGLDQVIVELAAAAPH